MSDDNYRGIDFDGVVHYVRSNEFMDYFALCSWRSSPKNWVRLNEVIQSNQTVTCLECVVEVVEVEKTLECQDSVTCIDCLVLHDRKA